MKENYILKCYRVRMCNYLRFGCGIKTVPYSVLLPHSACLTYEQWRQGQSITSENCEWMHTESAHALGLTL
jgi:hypothetical protein